MDALETTINALCAEAERLVSEKRPEKNIQKWVGTKNGAFVDERPDYGWMVSSSLARPAFTNTDAYKEMVNWIAQDSDLSKAPEKMGANGSPFNIIHSLLLRSMLRKGKRITFDPAKPISAINHLREFLNADEIVYDTAVRLLGVKLTVPRLPIVNDVELVRLTTKEINERQPDISIAGMTGSPTDLHEHNTEIRARIRVPIDRGKSPPILLTENVAIDEATTIFDNLASAVRLHKTGYVELGTIWVFNSFFGLGTGKPYLPRFHSTEIKIGNADGAMLQNAFQVVAEAQLKDNVLKRALHRFLLGRQRTEMMDQIVDYVIAWESILLTTRESGAFNQELSYRFGINGASLLRASNIQRDRNIGLRVMRGIYDVRSKIVHGSNESDIAGALKKAGFATIEQAVKDTEEMLRRVIFWLSELSPDARPYNATSGWEILLWGK